MKHLMKHFRQLTIQDHIVSVGFAWRSELFPVCRSKHRFVKAFLIGYSAWRFEGGVSNMHADWVISNVSLQANN